MLRLLNLAFAVILPQIFVTDAQAQNWSLGNSPADRMLAAYFEHETNAISAKCLADVKTREDWLAKKEEYRRQLAEMLGVWPAPPKTDLQATVTGTTDAPEFTVERLHFQSLPHLYVTADLYVPKNLSAPAPAILYVCGHSEVKKNGISFGNKVAYQHHGEWFARNGYVCLTIDTIQYGEIEGHHHGTYSEGMWWWQSRGYTPAGVETWNGIRAIDYLCSRKEVDPNRIGMTGRSGGGAYTWYVSALDERIKVACPIAGITDLHNHIVDGCIEGHCDCMFMVNTYCWDFSQVAALLAPRPLLIGNSDKDSIFPLDGVMRVHDQVRKIYRLLGAEKNLGLLITEGPHQDTQDLQVPVFRWFNRFLKDETGPVDKVATSFFEPQQLRVFDKLPSDQIDTSIEETFVPKAPAPQLPTSAKEWNQQREKWVAALTKKTFGGWPQSPADLEEKQTFAATKNGMRLRVYDFMSQHDVGLRLFVAQAEKTSPKQVILRVQSEATWNKWIDGVGRNFADELGTMAPRQSGTAAPVNSSVSSPAIFIWFAPRGIGPTAWTGDAMKQAQILRRFALLGQTLDGMRVWDVRRAIQAIRSVDDLKKLPLVVRSESQMAVVSLYAGLFEPGISRLELVNLPASHNKGPQLLNVLQTMDIEGALAAVLGRTPMTVYANLEPIAYAKFVSDELDWPVGQLTTSTGTPRNWP